MLRRAAALLGGLGAALLLGELAARLLPDGSAAGGPRLQRFEGVVSEAHGMSFDSAFEGDPRLFWRLRPNVRREPSGPLPGVVSNAAGLREDHELPVPRPSGERRVLFVGDSVTFGYGLALEETFVERAEEQLAPRFAQTHVECIDAGVPGWTLYQGWRWLADEGLALEPDVVVLNFGWNEGATWDGLGDLELARLREEAEPPAALAWSALARRAWRAAAPGPPTDGLDPARPRVTPGEFRELLGRCAEAARGAGAELLVLVGAVPENCAGEGPRRSVLQEVQLAFCAAEGQPVLDAIPLVCELAGEGGAARLYFDGVHPRAPVARALGAALADALEPLLRARGAR